MNQVTVIEPAQQLPAVTPMHMLQLAVQQNADIDKLQKLMELQERWEANQARKAFDAAIANAKAKIKPIVKSREVDFTSPKGRTHYAYEDMALIANEVDPILSEFGLSYRYKSKQEGVKLSVTCVVSHRDGYSEETSLTANNDDSGNKNSLQSIGSTATYLQRYTLKLALGLSAAKDTDGNVTKEQVEAPSDYEDWKADMTALADEGLTRLEAGWKKSAADLRKHAIAVDGDWWAKMKTKAQAVQQ